MKNLNSILIMTALIVSACGQDNSKSAPAASKAVSDTNIVALSLAEAIIGTWESDCIDSAKWKQVYTKDGNNINTLTVYQDTKCAAAQTVNVATRTYTISGDNDIDYTYEKVTMAASVKFIVDIFNLGQNFGYNDWALNEPKDITDLIASSDANAPLFPKGEKLYQIMVMSADGKTMNPGDNRTAALDGSTEAKRPVKVYKELIYTKK